MAKKLKLSPWHDVSVNPVHVGVYELKQPEGETFIYSWWDKSFRGAWPSLEQADHMRSWNELGCAIYASAWRGVLK